MSVVVLVSTYNGARFIEAQINSLLSQNYSPITIHIRDDGSSDNTREILSRYSEQYSRVQCRYENNIGVVSSFFELLRNSGESFEYYSFCDQDDVWQQNKISRAIEQMEAAAPNTPLMYFTRVEYVDEKLNHLGYSAPPKRISYEHAMVENMATGCTIVINRSARELILSHLPVIALMHDWWMFLVISAFGQIIYDPVPLILYRQHSSNVVGGTTYRFKANIDKILPFLKHAFNPRKIRTSDQVREFKRLYSERLNINQLTLINELLDAKPSIRRRLKIVASGRYRRQNIFDHIVFSALILIGYY